MIRPLILALALALVLALLAWQSAPENGPRRPAPAPSPEAGVDALLDTLDRLEHRLVEVIDQVRESAVALEYTAPDESVGTRRVATGVVLNDGGEVLSVNIAAPADDAEPVVARDASGHRHATEWLAADPETGLTLLRVEADDLRPIRPSARAATLGMSVLVIGNPFGLGHSVRRGSVGGLDRRLDVGPRPLGGLIQVNVPLHPGDSGALMVDLRGEWLGLIRSGLAAPGAWTPPDLGFAIPARDAAWVAGQLRAHRRVDRAYLGVRFDPSPTADAPGAILTEVLADTPASRAGLRPGDRLAALDGRPIRVPSDLVDRLDRTRAGTDVTLDVVRGPRRDRLVLRTAGRAPITPSPPPRTPVELSDATKADDPGPPPSQVADDRLDRLERRLDELEQQGRVANRP